MTLKVLTMHLDAATAEPDEAVPRTYVKAHEVLAVHEHCGCGPR